MLQAVPIDWAALRRYAAIARTGRRRDRDGKPWTLGDLAKASGLDPATIHRIENTKKYPTYKPDLDSLAQRMCDHV